MEFVPVKITGELIAGVKHPIHILCSVPTLIKDGILKQMDYRWSVYRVVPSAHHVLRHNVTSYC